MGTRNLTMVVIDGQYRVAQYGQWDGYPDGAGKSVLKFLSTYNREKFIEQVRALRFITREEIISEYVKLGIDLSTDWIKWEDSRKFQEAHPQLDRDMGADILRFIHNAPPGVLVKNDKEFAANGLFCEWAWLIDLDNNKLEVYRGFRGAPKEGDRFFDLMDEAPVGHDGTQYYPITKLVEYDLSNLPTPEQLVIDCKTADKKEEKVT